MRKQPNQSYHDVYGVALDMSNTVKREQGFSAWETKKQFGLSFHVVQALMPAYGTSPDQLNKLFARPEGLKTYVGRLVADNYITNGKETPCFSFQTTLDKEGLTVVGQSVTNAKVTFKTYDVIQAERLADAKIAGALSPYEQQLEILYKIADRVSEQGHHILPGATHLARGSRISQASDLNFLLTFLTNRHAADYFMENKIHGLLRQNKGDMQHVSVLSPQIAMGRVHAAQITAPLRKEVDFLNFGQLLFSKLMPDMLPGKETLQEYAAVLNKQYRTQKNKP